MPYIPPPVVSVETALGPIELAFTDGTHVYAHSKAHANDSRPAIVYRGQEYLPTVHLYLEHGWDEDRRPGAHDGVSKRGSSTAKAAKTHRAAIVSAIRDAVLAYLETDPDVLRRAAYANTNNRLEDVDRDLLVVRQALSDLEARKRELELVMLLNETAI